SGFLRNWPKTTPAKIEERALMKTIVDRKYFPASIRGAVFALGVLLLSAPRTYGYWAGGILLKDTHCVIAERAVRDLDRNSFPDIWKFAAPLQCSDSGGHPGGIILRAAPNGESHSEIPGGRGKQFWSRNEFLWADRRVDEYTRFNSQSAYDYTGRVAHLNADTPGPPHAKVVFQGGPPPL